LLSLLSAQACPAEIRVCRDGAHVSYQDRPCPAGTVSRIWSSTPMATPTPVPPGQASAVRHRVAVPGRVPSRARRTRAAARENEARGGAALIRIQQDLQACARAREAHLRFLQSATRAPGYLQQREWEDRLRRACQ